MWYQLKAYIKFLLKSKNQHGVHSPFVFDLVTKCFYESNKYSDYSKIQSYRKSLLGSTEFIHIIDYGSGSRVFDSNKRTIKNIAKSAGTPYKRAKLLYRCVRYFKPDSVLELGTSLGISAISMALANPNIHLLTIEGCPETSQFTTDKLKEYQIKNVSVKTGQFSEVIPTLENQQWDLVFFDGHHDKDATLHYFEQLLPTVHNDTVFIFDDIHWSKGMTKAWERIKKHPQVSLTIDTFYWGFVFFRKEQAKENFVIRL